MRCSATVAARLAAKNRRPYLAPVDRLDVTGHLVVDSYIPGTALRRRAGRGRGDTITTISRVSDQIPNHRSSRLGNRTRREPFDLSVCSEAYQHPPYRARGQEQATYWETRGQTWASPSKPASKKSSGTFVTSSWWRQAAMMRHSWRQSVGEHKTDLCTVDGSNRERGASVLPHLLHHGCDYGTSSVAPLARHCDPLR